MGKKATGTDGQPRTKAISVAVTKTENKKLMKAAKREGMSIQSYTYSLLFPLIAKMRR